MEPMKCLGLLGGMSWESTAVYYRLLNEGAAARFGGLHSAPLLLWSCDFAPVARRQAEGDWAGLADLLADAARRLEGAGAEGLLLCTNTMHRCFDTIQAAVAIPLLHIADVTAEAVRARGCRRPALLATRFTMEQDFYRGRLDRDLGTQTLIPDAAGRATVHAIIYEELCRGRVLPGSKAQLLSIVEQLSAQGADGIILGCTELGLALGQSDVGIPLFDTTALHAAAGLAFACR